MEPIRIELPTVFEAMTVNSWLFLEPEVTIVDCGEKTDGSWNALQMALAKHGLQISDIKRIIVTHGHLDHMGMANKIVENSDAVVWMNEYLVDWAIDLKKMLDGRTKAILSLMKPLLPSSEHSKYFGFGYETLAPLWDEIPYDRIKTFSVEDQLTFGNRNWEVIYTPGHCINQTCFYHRETGDLLSADMLLRIIPIPIIDARLEPPFERTKSLWMQLQSYELLDKLKINKVYPGHFNSFEDGNQVIKNQISKIHARKDKCLSLYKNGMTEILDLTHAIYPDRLNEATIFMVVGFLDILEMEKKIQPWS